MGLAPTASVALAESLMTTLFVIFFFSFDAWPAHLMYQRGLCLDDVHERHDLLYQVLDFASTFVGWRKDGCGLGLCLPRPLEGIDHSAQHLGGAIGVNGRDDIRDDSDTGQPIP